MDLSAIFLGTGGSVPSARRSTASVVLARGGKRLMFDCGEGTQRQLQRSIGLAQVDEIFLTHFHADHVLGLPGLLKTYDLTAREEPLTIYGPRGLRDLFRTLGRLIGRTDYDIDLVELDPGDAVPHDGARGGHSRSSTACVRTATSLSRRRDPAASTPRRQRGLGSGKARLSPRCSAGRGWRAAMARSSPGGDGRAKRQGARSRSPATRLPAIRRSRQRPTPTCSSTTRASPKRRPSAPRIPATRPSARPPPSPARPTRRCSPSSISPPATTSAPSSTRHARSSSPASPRSDFDLIEIPFPERGEPRLVPNGAREAQNDLSNDKLPGEEPAAGEGVSGMPPPGTAE